MTMQLNYAAIATDYQQWHHHVGRILSLRCLTDHTIGERIDMLIAVLGPEDGGNDSREGQGNA